MHKLQVGIILENASSEQNKEHCQVGSVRAYGLRWRGDRGVECEW